MRTLFGSFKLIGPVSACFCLMCLTACEEGEGPAASSDVQAGEVGPSAGFQEPNLSFARQLGIRAGQISEQDARAIAELATGGTALSVEREDEDAEATFDVLVRVADATQEVEIRMSDGAVLEIEDESEEADDSDEEGEEEHEEVSSQRG